MTYEPPPGWDTPPPRPGSSPAFIVGIVALALAVPTVIVLAVYLLGAVVRTNTTVVTTTPSATTTTP